ncbi:MAG: hypothetical protein HQ547_03620 [Candidatus Omnitrophica bacterium]|nr:hypothetical protein [Candidatus Omnitrophota bacterium]
MNKRIYIQIEFLIILLAFLVGIYSQWASFFNQYVINDDVNQHIYWMQQFQDNGLFRNDLLTEYAKNYQPWGFVALYYILSFIVDPMIVSKVIPIILLMVSSLYLFRLVRHITNDYAGFLAASIFIVTPIYLNRMIGGEPRAFGYPLLIILLYYLVRKEYLKSSFVLILQCLFYPIVFLLSILTYLFTLIKMQHKEIFFDKAITQRKYFIIAVMICGVILCSKYIISYNPSIGRIVTREQMVGNSEYYFKGRVRILPTPPLFQQIRRSLQEGMVFSKIFNRSAKMISLKPGEFDNKLIFLITILFLIAETIRKKLIFPIEIMFLFISSVLMYIIADLFLFKLFLPIRYLSYSLPLISLIICAIAIGQLIIKIKSVRIKKAAQILILILIFLNVSSQRSNGLTNTSYNKSLYSYLNSLPKETVIAAHPVLANNIPTFAQRKVFINYELSHCVFDNYWKTIKKRTFDFFDAYYSEDPSFIYEFCERNGIDYLVIDKRHFTEKYLRGSIYIEPFSTYVKNITRKRKKFFLDTIPEENKLFTTRNVFVIKKDILNVSNFKDVE